MNDLEQFRRPSSRQVVGLLPMLRYLRPYWPQLIGGGVALVITAAVSLSIGQGIRYLVDYGFQRNGSSDVLVQAIAFFSILVLLLTLGTFMRFYLVSWIGERLSADLRNRVFRHVIKLNPAFFETHLASDIQSRITTDTTILQNVIGSSVSIAARSLIMCIGAAILLAYTNLKLAAIVFASVPLVVFPIFIFGRSVRGLSRKSQEGLATVGSYVNEVVKNIKTVHANLHDPIDVTQFTERVESAFRVAVKRILARALLTTLVMVTVLTAIALMLWVGGQDVIAGRTTPGELAAFLFYAFMMTVSVAAIGEVYGELQRAAGATERLLELLAVRSELPEPTVPEVIPKTYTDILTFDRVSYAYSSRPETLVLQDLSFRVRDGEYVALVGPSGAGKSTLFELILRFYDPQSGSVSFADVDVRSLTLDSLRSRIAVVPQDLALFRGTIRDNIVYARPDASESEIQQAAEAGHVLEFTERLPNGLATEVGENGLLLSGGQRQRIAVARAILKKPRLLLLDEATSSLDAESELAVRSALAKLRENTTTLVIAHRLATARDARRILLLSKGKLLASGTHQELMEQSLLYARLVELQLDIGSGAHANSPNDLGTDELGNVSAFVNS